MAKENLHSRYDNIDGLRTIAAIGIIMMHVMTNGKYSLADTAVSILYKSADFAQLFFVISGFGMCCGYYDKIKKGNISINTFYIKRFQKILPFFALCVFIDIGFALVNHSFSASVLIEALSNLTLMFGFLPAGEISVIGVGWTLGVIFAFYCIFPFFVFMLWGKVRAWVFFIISLMFNYACSNYFLSDGQIVKCSLLLWLCFFVAGGMVYLYRECIIKFIGKHRIISFIVIAVITAALIIAPDKIYSFSVAIIKQLVIFSLWLCYGISVKSHILSNPLTRFISKISLEIYLSHMVIFRLAERFELTHLSNADELSYLITVCIVIAATIVFSAASKAVINKIMSIFVKA